MVHLLWLMGVMFFSALIGWGLLYAVKGDSAFAHPFISFTYCVLLPVCVSATFYAVIY